MGFLGTPYRRHPRRFERQEPAEDDRRVRFRGLSPYPRPRGRSLLWILVMILFVVYLLYYLSTVKG